MWSGGEWHGLATAERRCNCQGRFTFMKVFMEVREVLLEQLWRR